jgi:hypothetical protein
MCLLKHLFVFLLQLLSFCPLRKNNLLAHMDPKTNSPGAGTRKRKRAEVLSSEQQSDDAGHSRVEKVRKVDGVV